MSCVHSMRMDVVEGQYCVVRAQHAHVLYLCSNVLLVTPDNYNSSVIDSKKWCDHHDVVRRACRVVSCCT